MHCAPGVRAPCSPGTQGLNYHLVMHAQDGRTPLFWASQEGQLPVVQVLIANGAAVDKAKHVSGI